MFLKLEHLVTDGGHRWAYAEGYGLADDGAFPHAWNLGDEGVVIDQTWPEPESNAYFGIEFHEQL